ncbi:MAG: 50S ribosomal protein L24 [Fibromonadaceae bacterium]|jgi:large subunit ribosomal protein L24|nr:50S ribosomal protein L24 [Fibromonadaceae bacterium]
MPAIKKNDEVVVITGAYKGRNGKMTKGIVTKVFPKLGKIIVSGINVRKKHEKPNKVNQNGGIVEKEMPIHISNVMLLEGGVPVRTKRVREPGKKSVRVSVKTGKAI